jgi:hypothetical protein
LLSPSFLSTATSIGITTKQQQNHHERVENREKQKKKREAEENKVKKKNTEKKKEERPTTVQAILRSATASSTAFRATTGQPSAPYLVLLFISLHAERALCTFCKQENNHPVTMHVQQKKLL